MATPGAVRARVVPLTVHGGRLTVAVEPLVLAVASVAGRGCAEVAARTTTAPQHGLNTTEPPPKTARADPDSHQ
jgi:hypothetical protein